MALANAAVVGPSLYGVSRITKAPFLGSHGDAGSGFCGSSFCIGSHAGKSDVILERRKLKSVDDNNNRIVENPHVKSSVEIPVSCYQVIKNCFVCCLNCVCVCLCVLFIFHYHCYYRHHYSNLQGTIYYRIQVSLMNLRNVE